MPLGKVGIICTWHVWLHSPNWLAIEHGLLESKVIITASSQHCEVCLDPDGCLDHGDLILWPHYFHRLPPLNNDCSCKPSRAQRNPRFRLFCIEGSKLETSYRQLELLSNRRKMSYVQESVLWFIKMNDASTHTEKLLYNPNFPRTRIR